MNINPSKNGRIMRVKEVALRVGVSRSTIYRMLLKGKFPPSFAISRRCIGWRESDIDDFITKLSLKDLE
ncbi:AlpA family phage regulatory protein [Chitinibacter bivalviorum]|uniref:AlpA family phage regulatory protein n=1 Tax=Chitinibacter bivalviorum TaxID=2739434 RepID=A0A7H9BHH9_9NEIS|nr:AlpA family phage regulatory protein [Chitinibacter bivalviorum]QLG87999.1 AlpA family phage regulatory protein [Chitinibacter bivalviorum]